MQGPNGRPKNSAASNSNRIKQSYSNLQMIRNLSKEKTK